MKRLACLLLPAVLLLVPACSDDDPATPAADYVPVGTTDASGEVVLTDRRLFPHFYDRPDMIAVDEAGEPMGPLVLTADMLFFLEGQDYAMQRYERVVEPGTRNIELVWTDPVVPPMARSAAPFVPRDVDVPAIGEFELRLPYPNPFN